MEKREYENERKKMIRQLVVSIVYQVIPVTGYLIFHNKWSAWFLTVSLVYLVLSIIVLPIWISKNKP